MILLRLTPLLLLLYAAPAFAQGRAPTALTVQDAWARATPPAAPVAGGYLTITNAGKDADRLLRITAANAESAEIYELMLVDGIARMRSVADLAVPAGETIKLAAGGLHIMFIKPKARLREGDRFAATLIFEKAGAIEVGFAVQGIGARESVCCVGCRAGLAALTTHDKRREEERRKRDADWDEFW